MNFLSTLPIDKLNRQHSYYSEVLQTWNQLEVLNCGGYRIEAVMSNYLRKRPKEPAMVYAARLAAASYTNLVGNITGWYDSALWQNPPECDFSPDTPDAEKFRALWSEDVTRTNVNDRRFFKGVVESMLINKFAYVLLDMPVPDQEPQSKGDQLAQRLLDPLLIQYRPQDIINWGEDRFGSIQWVVIKTVEQDQEFGADPTPIDVWMVYTPVEVVRYSKSQKDTGMAAQLSQGYPRPHALSQLGKLPLYRLSVPDGLWFGNRVKLPLLNHLNMDNAFDWGLASSCLAQLFIKGKYGNQSQGNAQPTVSEVAYHQLEIGGDMGYVEPAGTSYGHSAERIAALEERIYKACFLQAQARTNKSTAMAQSGISKQQDMTPANDALSGIGDVIRPAFKRIWTDVMTIAGFPCEVNVRGFEFNDRSLGRLELFDAASIIDVQSTTYHKQIAKDTVRVLWPDKSDKWYAVIDQEIDVAPTGQEIAAANVAAAQVSGIAKFQKTLGGLQTAV